MRTFCRICESLCGLEVEVEGNRVTAIRPDAGHVATQGFACPKGLKQHRLYASPDRLTAPRKRIDGGFADTTWDDALEDIGSRLRRIRERHGPDAIGMYVGTAAGFGVLHPVFAQGFMDGIGSRNLFSSATQDCANKFAVSQRLYGFPFTLPFPDLLHTKFLIIVGANPMVSKWSFLQVPNPRRHLNAIRERGGRVLVVDPRCTETAKAAGEHLAIRPNSDVYFYLAFLNRVIAEGGVDQQRVAQHMDGYEDVAAIAADWTPERAAAHTGIPAAVMAQLVADYCAADGAALYCSTGVNMGAHGSAAFYLQEVINAVSGNLDRRGGTLVGKGILDFARFGVKHNLLVKDDRSRIGGFSKTNDAFPGGILADEILTAGAGQIRALIVTGGNPLLTMADGDKLRRAFRSLELLITLDIQPSETGQLAHYQLPCTTPLERPDLPFVFPLTLGLQVRPYLQATEAVLEPPGEARDEATIYADLAAAVGRPLFGSRIFQTLVQATRRRRPGQRYRSVAQRGLLNLLLRLCGQPGFRRLLGPGVWRPPHAPGSFLGQRVYTRPRGDGRVQLAPAELIEALRALASAATAPADHPAGSYAMITRRQVETHNSWTHNLPDFLERLEQRNFLYLHPEDAAREGIRDDTLVEVASAAGSIRLPARLLADLSPGVVAVPHGWGHQASGLTHAREAKGVNVNLLARSGVDAVDPISGMSQLTGLRVTLRVADNDLAPGTATDWSGRPANRTPASAGAAEAPR